MNYKVYIQSLNGFPLDDWAVSAYLGFKQKQANIILYEDIEEVPTRGSIVVGCIEDTNKFLERLGLPPKKALNIPDELLRFAGRKIEHMTMGEFRKDTRVPIFVKPDGKAKEFVAGVISKNEHKEFYFNGIDDATPVFVSEVVDIISEYRGYVIEGVLKGIKHYTGDFRIFPDMKIVDEAISEYKFAPAGYSIDFGITKDGRTILIECNDGFSLGNYGLESSIYVNLLCKRWFELVKGM